MNLQTSYIRRDAKNTTMLLSQSMVHGQHIGPWITATQE